jgi:hypothetical protein
MSGEENVNDDTKTVVESGSDPEVQENQQEQKDVDAKTDEQNASKSDGDKKTKILLSDDEDKGSDAKSKVPEKYEFEAPEDFEISEEVQSKLDAFGETAKEMGLSQDQYQKLVEYDIQRGQAAIEASATQYAERVESWAEATRTDKELGGESLKENLAIAKSAIDAFGSDELRKLISAPSAKNPDGLGLGNHPELIRFMCRVGRSIGEDRLIEGDGSEKNDQDALKRMYPTMFKEAS